MEQEALKEQIYRELMDETEKSIEKLEIKLQETEKKMIRNRILLGLEKMEETNEKTRQEIAKRLDKDTEFRHEEEEIKNEIMTLKNRLNRLKQNKNLLLQEL